MRGTPAATTIIADATQAAGTDPRRRALILALAADVVYGIPGGRRAAAVEAIDCAQAAGAGAEPALHRALLNLVAAKMVAAEGLDTDLLDQAGRLESRIAVTRLYDTANLQRGLLSRYVEDLETSRAAMTLSIGQAADAGDDYAQATFLAYLAATEQLAGDYTAARAALDTADAIAAWHHWPPSAYRLDPFCEQLIADGKLSDALHVVDTQLADETRSATEGFFAALVRGKVSGWENDPAAAVAHLERAARWADENEWTDPGVRCRVDVLLAEAYADTDRAASAARISITLREIGTRLERPALIGDADRIDALIAGHQGDLDAAAGLARSAVAAHEASPLRVEVARSLLVLGRIERRRKARKHARAALTRARDLAANIAHRPLLAEIERELPRTAGTRSSNALTATEQRVAELIAQGATNRDAATALFVSVRTVETHLATIYRKLGIHRRVELTRRLSEEKI
jgi:ATP/maltotriose-dependent transcriptional regulator MalT